MKKIIKGVSVLAALILVGLGLSSCFEGSVPALTSTSPTSKEPIIIDPTTTKTSEGYTEVADVAIPSGKYMVNSTLYDYNKENKRVIVTKYDTYTAYKNNQGTKLFDTTVKFVSFSPSMSLKTFSYDSIYFKNGDTEYFAYVEKKESGDFLRFVEKKGISETTNGWLTTSSIVEPSYGNYVSNVQNDYKVDSEGNRIPNDNGGYVKEDFYLFLELTATSAKLYVGDNNEVHSKIPLHEVSNYELLLRNGYVVIQIPHKNGSYNCSLTILSQTQIRFTNYSEETPKYGQYSGQGTFTKTS